jgi:hypothetical protein
MLINITKQNEAMISLKKNKISMVFNKKNKLLIEKERGVCMRDVCLTRS